MLRGTLLALLLGLSWPSLASAADTPALIRARTLYNAGDFDGAIQAASTERQTGALDAAAVVIGRAHLERFRQGGDAAALELARAALSSARAGALTPREQVELLIGLGQSLYLEGVYGAAAELFDTALGRSAVLAPRDRVLLLDWWATALDREAQSAPPERRPVLFARVSERMEQELRTDPGNGPANYWLVASIRGMGDASRAWDAAVAGWIRASFDQAAVASVRSDLDRLVTDALSVELGRLRGGAEPQEAIAAAKAQWEQVKSQWK